MASEGEERSSSNLDVEKSREEWRGVVGGPGFLISSI